MAAKGFTTKPIWALPLTILHGVKKTKFYASEKGKSAKFTRVLNKNQFELCYK